ncbi:immune inhibitor A domain-containing protein [Tahibacter amnicola]|uniref:Immune inhibitor A n=1 Tax=Tahibacter amnicola TaxID=2976241 RepID=A0ABY6BGG3_9GAMM|nr:immune inhibitor A domain-containing protein [Tahibacter amnicola]UXI68398.1 immune inhibitor A [Tahibacter amnicola]
MKVARTMMWVALAGVFAGAQAADAPYKPVESVNSQGIKERRGAQLLGVSTPETFTVNMAELPTVREWQPGDSLVEIPRRHWEEVSNVIPEPVNPVSSADPLVPLQFEQALRGSGGFTTPIINIDGSTSQASPPDPSGDVGTRHFVQAVNAAGGSQVRIYRKSDGSLVNSITMTSLGGTGACASGLGDPIVLFDQLANRWVLTEFSTQAGRSLCVYVSSTDDLEAPSVTWHRYTFTMPAFPDYPKYGVWPDAYYVGANEGGTSGQRPFYVMDRAKMLAGEPATFQRVTVPNLSGFGFQMTTPADHDGIDAPPAGAPGIFLRHRDDESHNAGSNNPNQDFLELWHLKPDFTTPANTVLTGPVSIPVAEFSSNLNGLTAFEAFPQPSGQLLDPLREPIMNRLAYRNFGTHESLVGNLVTDIDGNDTGGIRWFELRRTGGINQPWTLYQEGTYAGNAQPQDGTDRWMAGIAQDSSGNIAMAYSAVRQSPAVFPSLRYVGRRSDDPLGTMTTPETTLVAGTGNHSNERWGDYFQLNVDPVDNCTFWFTGLYMPTNSKGTRISSFRFDACGSPTFTVSGNNLTQEVCTASGPAALSPISVSVGSTMGFSDPVAMSFANTLPPGFSGDFTPATVTPPGTSTLAMSVAQSAAAGAYTIGVNGTSGATTRFLNASVAVSTQSPTVPTLTVPANNATNVAVSPVLTWTASTQAKSYIVEVSTDPNFSTIVATQNVTGGTSVTVNGLAGSTQYYWRVRSQNICGTSTNSEVFSFRTLTLPGDCAVGQTTNAVFTENVEGATTGWTTSAATGTANWSVSTARPFGGTKSWLAVDEEDTTDQLLTSPAITLPTGQSPLTLSFQSDLNLEPRSSGGCWDGGYLEISTNDGSTWTQVPNTAMLTDPYTGAANDGPASGKQVWCGTRPYKKAVVDLNSYAGQTVRLRFRTSTDGSVGFTPHGWYVDDIRVQSCSSQNDGIFANGFEP